MNRGTLMVLKRFLITALGALSAGSAAFVQRARGGSRDAIFGGISQSTHCLTIERGKLMKRGTTKVLKRLFLTALGAFGLGALAAGPVFAQGQIPAPRLYGDITGCTTDAPDSVTKAGMRGGMTTPSKLDAAFEGVPNALTNSEQGDLTATLSPCNDGGANDIAGGFGRARDLYNRTAAARALATGEGATQTDIERFNEALQKQEAYGGAVYDAVYEETAAGKTVRDAIEKWNDFFDAIDPTVEGSGGAYTKARTNYDAIMVNDHDIATASTDHDDDSGTADVLSTMQSDYVNDYGVDMVRGFQAILGFDAESDGTVTALSFTGADTGGGQGGAADGTVSDEELQVWLNSSTNDTAFNDVLSGAFDVEGKLQFIASQTVTNTTGAGNGHVDDSVAGSANIDTLGEIVNHLSVWDQIVRVTEKIVADANPDTVANYEALQLRAARAKAARSHVQAEMDRLLGVARVQNRTVNGVSEVAALRSYDSVLGELRSAENVVRSTAAALEAARGKVKESLESAGSYLSQLVKLREYEKAQLIDLHDGTPPDSLLKAANEALEKAEMQQAAHAALAGETDNPANALLDELLKPATDADGNPADDDGQALITAISDTYDTAKSAEDTAMNAMNAVEGLGGEDGAVAMNTAAIMENADNITELDGRVTQNEENIAGNTTMIGENRTMIGENRTMIGENRDMIVTNAENIMTNASEIMRVEGRVDTNWDAIAANQMAISDNSASISSNADAIAANMNSIGSNTSAIGDNRNMIGELSDDLDVVRAGVAASMALAGMPAINGRGVSIGVGSFDGESAFAVGFQIQGEMASFKVGVTSASGATGASAGVGFQF